MPDSQRLGVSNRNRTKLHRQGRGTDRSISMILDAHFLILIVRLVVAYVLRSLRQYCHNSRSGLTFSALKLVLSRRRPRTGILENVNGLLRGDQVSNADNERTAFTLNVSGTRCSVDRISVRRELLAIGYACCYVRASPVSLAMRPINQTCFSF